MSIIQNFALSWDKHEQERTTRLVSIWENSDFVDVTLACDDGQIEAHKVILSAASPFFQKILKRNPHSHPLLYLRGTTKNTVESLLEFVYSGHTYVLQDQIKQFMEIARDFQIKGLAEKENDEENPSKTQEMNDENIG